MVSIKALERRGITADSLRKKLEDHYAGRVLNLGKLEDAATREDKVGFLVNRIRSRIQAGRDLNFQRYKIYHALDQALDVSFKQVEPTLIRAIANKDEQYIESCCKAWSLRMDEMWVSAKDPKTGKSLRKLNIPAFFEIFIPLSRAYLTIRWAKIMDGLYRTPLMSFYPTLNDEKTRLKCKIVESRIERMSEEYGYFQVWRQCVLQMLHYGTCLQFPVEEWHKESQEDDKGEAHIVREGLRYHMPHPARMYIDENHRASTINSDTGCEFAGYWRVMRYKDIRENPNFWNKDKVSLGPVDWWSPNSNFFQTIYAGCAMSFPSWQKPGSLDREGKMVDSNYTETWDDKAVQITEHYDKLIPADYGLGDYKYPVWFRFVVAGYDTIIYAVPVPYTPPIYWGYDPDENRDMNTSLTLETMAFQDHLSNLFQQYLISIRQNLDNITFINTDIVGEDWIDKIESKKSLLHKLRNFFPFSSIKHRRMQVDKADAFYSHRFPPLNTQDCVLAMKMILDMVERVLVMSSQEVGAAATHEQSAAEQKFIHSSTSTRLAFTSMGADQAIEAQKRQLYDALMQYGQDEFYAELPFTKKITPELLKSLGFTWNDKDPHSDDAKLVVKVPKTAIDIDSFTSMRHKKSKSEDLEAALALSNALATWLSSPLGPAIGADQAIKIIKIIGELAGFPQEFQQLENRTPEGMGDQQIKEELPQMLEALQQKIMADIGTALKPMMENEASQEEKLNNIAKAVGLLKDVVGMISSAAPQVPPQMPPQIGGPIVEPPPAGIPMLPPPLMP